MFLERKKRHKQKETINEVIIPSFLLKLFSYPSMIWYFVNGNSKKITKQKRNKNKLTHQTKTTTTNKPWCCTLNSRTHRIINTFVRFPSFYLGADTHRALLCGDRRGISDAIWQEHSPEILSAWKFVQMSEKDRVDDKCHHS